MNGPAAALPPRLRLHRRAEFTALRLSRERAGCPSFHARYLPNACGHARLGLAISKRVSSRAVERNRLKRLVRESFRRSWRKLPAVDVLVMARSQAAGVDGAQLLMHLGELWARLEPAHAKAADAPPNH